MVFHLNSAGVITCVFYKGKAKTAGVGTGASSSCLKSAASEICGNVRAGRGCSAFRVHQDVYKEMPHHEVECTSRVVTGFFTDVLGSSVA